MNAPVPLRLIGKYEILGDIRGGGMGVVYRARDTVLDRQVALKLIHGGGNAELRRRFEREAQILARISHHRNIVTIHDFGHLEEPPFIVMELLQGQPLDQAITATPTMTLRERIGVVRQALAGLECAHNADIVHRDIKPSNLFVTTDGEVKILDFGVARIEGGPVITSQIIGTCFYMSPEQLHSPEVDGRSDLFSLGVTLYELIAGVRPFDGPTQAATITRILNDEADLAPIRMHAPTLIPILRKALAKEARNRYQSAADFASAIDSVRMDELTLVSTKAVPPLPDPAAQFFAEDEEGTKDAPPPRQRKAVAEARPRAQARFPKPWIKWRSMAQRFIVLSIGALLAVTSWALYNYMNEPRSEHSLAATASDNVTSTETTSEPQRPFRRLRRDYNAALSKFHNLPPIDKAQQRCIETALSNAEDRLPKGSNGRLQSVESLRWDLNHCLATSGPARDRSPIIATVQELLTEEARDDRCPGLEPLVPDGVHGARTSAVLQSYVRCNALALWKIDQLETLGDYATIGLYLVQERQQ
jgi:serine/threonine protein kinase